LEAWKCAPREIPLRPGSLGTYQYRPGDAAVKVHTRAKMQSGIRLHEGTCCLTTAMTLVPTHSPLVRNTDPCEHKYIHPTHHLGVLQKARGGPLPDSAPTGIHKHSTLLSALPCSTLRVLHYVQTRWSTSLSFGVTHVALPWRFGLVGLCIRDMMEIHSEKVLEV